MLHTDVSVVFARWHQCAAHLVRPSQHPQRTRSAPLLSRFEYIDRQTCPGMSWAGPFSPPELLLHVWGTGPHLIHGSPRPPESPHPKRHLDRFSRFCTAHGRYRQTDTDRLTNRRRYYVCSNRPHLISRNGTRKREALK